MIPLEGVWAASVTPLTPNLEVDVERFHRYIGWLLDKGCHGVVVFGTTGEANSFTVAERRAVLDGLCRLGTPMDRVIVGTGCSAEPDTIELTSQASALGCAAALLLPPFYYKDVPDEGLFQYFSRVIEGLGASTPRVLFYHFPKMAGVGFSLSLLQRLEAAFPNVACGVKDSSGDADNLTRLVKGLDGMAVFAGSEALLPYAMNEGGVGCISATANVTSELARRVYEGENELGDLMIRTRRALESLPVIASMKHLLAEHFSEPQLRSVRPPLVPIGHKDVTKLSQVIETLRPLPNIHLEAEFQFQPAAKPVGPA
ncbi:MAG: dihydrodipicolinate synthase family protein [Rhodothermales bacterium]|nr:dihydrodipicolinate synthase family protein [Rhodothermales bacterium]